MKYLTPLLLLLFVTPSAADGARLLGTGGVMQIEGASGGGLVPWATIAGYGAGDDTGISAFISNVRTGDYQLDAVGAAWSYGNRLEISLARQNFDIGTLGIALDLPDTVLRQNIIGAKLRVAGDIVYGNWPQIAVGVQHKNLVDPAVANLIGARDDAGTDFYISASRLVLAGIGDRNFFWNATLRATKANQLGLLGFGGDLDDDYSFMLEAAAGVLLDRHTVIGIEYRQKPDNLSFAGEDDWADLFIAYLPSRSLSLTAAYVDLGAIGGLERQSGFYLSLQATFGE
ncbi:MAG TPA: DUF3034 family protein [Gammaproteobacteria bacterium]